MSNQTEQFTLNVYGRGKSGKGASYQTRKANKVPGIVYGPKMKSPINVSLETNQIIAVNRKAGKTALVYLKALDGAPKELESSPILIKQIQTHPYKNLLLHIDLHQIDLTKKIRVTVPVNYVGKAKGLAEGGLMNVSVRQVEIRCFPNKIPNQLDYDVTHLELNGSASVTDLEKTFSANKEIEFIYDSDYSLLSIVQPREEAVVAVVAAAPGAEGAAAAPGAPAAGGAAPAAGAPAAAAGKAPAAGAPKAPAKK
jgi:large subunit ribosomal protein L25